MVHLLPEFPKQSAKDLQVTMIAFYLSLPPEVSRGTLVSKDILTAVIKSNMPGIGKSIDGTVVSVDPWSSSSVVLQTNDNRNNKSEVNYTKATVGGICGGCLFVVVIAALWAVYVKNER